MRLAATNPVGRAEIARFRSRHEVSVVYRAAARLYMSGLEWESAYDVASDAFQTAQVAVT